MASAAAPTFIPVDPRFADDVRRDPDKLRLLVACARDFRTFLNVWHFQVVKKKDEDAFDDDEPQVIGRPQIFKLGKVLWPGQEKFVAAIPEHDFIFALKARKLGFTTQECAYDGWVMRFRDQNARVHLFSRREKAAQELLDAVKFGLRRLPDWMQLPETTSTTNELTLDATHMCPGIDMQGCRGEECEMCAGRLVIDDIRTCVAYPADEETAVEATCSHGHVDEWARMRNPEKVWQAIEPTMAGTCHIITTGRGPHNYSSSFWRDSLASDTVFYPFFVHALHRPDRDEQWLKDKAKGMTKMAFKQEYAMRWEDALYGGGDLFFESHEIDVAITDFRGPSLAEKGRKYVKSWDIGRHQDAAVGIVLDVTDEVEDVVWYKRYRRVTYPTLQARIEHVHEAFPGPTVIEKNSAGEAVMENLDIPEDDLIGFSTTGQSKPKMLDGLKIGFQNQLIRFDPDEWPQLENELRWYQIPDKDIVQDSVIALAIGHAHAPEAYQQRGRLLKVGTW